MDENKKQLGEVQIMTGNKMERIFNAAMEFGILSERAGMASGVGDAVSYEAARLLQRQGRVNLLAVIIEALTEVTEERLTTGETRYHRRCGCGCGRMYGPYPTRTEAVAAAVRCEECCGPEGVGS
jgi:hypothetical protein